MGEKRYRVMDNDSKQLYCIESVDGEMFSMQEIVELLNEQQELIEELQVSDEMGWKRAEHFEKKCPKELHNKKMYIKRLEYKVQKFKEMNNEQQDTIRKLQDLCGKSDYENAKLRIENNILNKNEDDLEECTIENIKLKGENEQLKKEIKNKDKIIEVYYAMVELNE